jgi:hypothetical protein
VEYLAVFVRPYRYGIPFGKLGRLDDAHRFDGIVLAARGRRSVRGNDVDLEILVGAREVLPEGCTNGVICRDRVTLEKLEIAIKWAHLTYDLDEPPCLLDSKELLLAIVPNAVLGIMLFGVKGQNVHECSVAVTRHT